MQYRHVRWNGPSCTLKDYHRKVNKNCFACYYEAVFCSLWNTITKPILITRTTLPHNKY